MKIAVCDDEELFLNEVCTLIEGWAGTNDISLMLYKFTNGDDLISAEQKECMDLIILDIIMPLLNGMDTARELRAASHMVPIIFLTSSRDFAVDSYEVKALNYLLKPVDAEKLLEVLDDFLKELKLPKNIFTAQTGKGFLQITISDVNYLEAQNKQVLLHMSDGKTTAVNELFSKCADIFSAKTGFCRCHRSYIVNLNKVKQFTKSEIITSDNEVVPISRSSYIAFKEAYFKHMFSPLPHL